MLKGEMRGTDDGITYVPSQDEMELLMSLHSNPAWQIYRKILQQLHKGYVFSATSMIETNPIVKTIGMAAGINLSVNYLESMIGIQKRRADRVASEEGGTST